MQGTPEDLADVDDFLNAFEEDVPTDDLIEGVTIQIPEYPPSTVDNVVEIPLDNHVQPPVTPSQSVSPTSAKTIAQSRTRTAAAAKNPAPSVSSRRKRKA